MVLMHALRANIQDILRDQQVALGLVLMMFPGVFVHVQSSKIKTTMGVTVLCVGGRDQDLDDLVSSPLLFDIPSFDNDLLP